MNQDRKKHRLSDTQLGVLWYLDGQGPIKAEEILGFSKMSGASTATLCCPQMSMATMKRLEAERLIIVQRARAPHPVNAVGKAGRLRNTLTIRITGAGREALGKAKD
jgi:hypothetical protein